MTSPGLVVENVVAGSRLGETFDIVGLARVVEGAEHHPARFAGLIVHLAGGNALVFEDGRVVTTGARGVEEALAMHERVRSLLAQAGAETSRVEGFKIENVVAVADAGRSVPLSQVKLALPGEDIEYDSARFPGLVYRTGRGGIVLLVFSSGKVVATGSGDLPLMQEVLAGFVAAIEKKGILGAA